MLILENMKGELKLSLEKLMIKMAAKNKNKQASKLLFYFAITLFIASLAVFFINVDEFVKITGKATGTGITNLTIESSTSINFTISNISFGSGSVNLGSRNATIDTLGNVINGNWTPVIGGFKLENIGNTEVTLYLRSSKTASEFLGGTSPAYQYNVTDYDAGSCINGTGFNLGLWRDVNTTGEGDLVCNTFGTVANSIKIDLRLVIPSDARIGSQSDVFTAIGTAV
jgi:hypothetical protein